MELATFIGISISEFWEITPFELSIAYKAYSKRKEIEAEEYKVKIELNRHQLAVQAYYISRWVWQKKVNIEKILGAKKEKKTMTDDEMEEEVKALNALFGGEVRTVGKE